MTDQVSGAVACRSCGASIRFVETKGGRLMPVDAELVKTFLLPPAVGSRALVLVTERGEVRRGVEASVTDQKAEPVEGYRPHWASCTKPAAHRKERA
jgi:hypothetical protein